MSKIIEVLGDKVNLRITAKDTNNSYSLLEFETPEGVGQPPHCHSWDETYIVLEGKLNLNINGNESILSAGSSMDVPSGCIHSPISLMESTRYLMISRPAGVESVFLSLDANKEDLDDMNRVVEIVTKEGVKISM